VECPVEAVQLSLLISMASFYLPFLLTQLRVGDLQLLIGFPQSLVVGMFDDLGLPQTSTNKPCSLGRQLRIFVAQALQLLNQEIEGLGCWGMLVVIASPLGRLEQNTSVNSVFVEDALLT
jgi:hypothetical protein